MTTPADSEDQYDTTYPLPYAPPDGATAAADKPQAPTEHFDPYQHVPPGQAPFAQAPPEQAPFAAAPPEPVPGESTQPGMSAATTDEPVEPDARGRSRWPWIVVAGVLALAAGVGVGVLVTPDPTQTPEYRALAGELSETEQGRDALSEKYGTLQGDYEALQEQVKEREDELDTRAGKLDERESGLDERADALDEREASLDEREKAVQGAEEQQAANSITSGTWTVGVDVKRGTYRTKEAVSGMCYWGIYESGTNKDNILQNDIVTGGHPTVSLSEGQDFESSRCGTWVKQ